MLCCVAWCASECSMKAVWSSITCSASRLRTSWSAVCRRKCSNWDWPSPSTTLASSSASVTSGKYCFPTEELLSLSFAPTLVITVWLWRSRCRTSVLTIESQSVLNNGLANVDCADCAERVAPIRGVWPHEHWNSIKVSLRPLEVIACNPPRLGSTAARAGLLQNAPAVSHW